MTEGSSIFKNLQQCLFVVVHFRESRGILSFSTICFVVCSSYLFFLLFGQNNQSSTEILADNLRAKVSDFGFSRAGSLDPESTHVVTQVKGTPGYLDPEYFRTYKLTPKSDVYAFGILLVELLTGRKPIEHDKVTDEKITVRWVSFLYSHVK